MASTISAIRQTASAVRELQDKVRRQEVLIYEQRQALANLKGEKQTAFAELAEIERAAKAERERADRAESKVQSGEAQIRRLEDYSVSLKPHLTSLIAVARDDLAGTQRAAVDHAS